MSSLAEQSFLCLITDLWYSLIKLGTMDRNGKNGQGSSCEIVCKSQRQEHSSPGTNLSDSNGLINIFSSDAAGNRQFDLETMMSIYFLLPHWNTESDCWPNRNQGALDQLFVCCFVAWATKLRYCCSGSQSPLSIETEEGKRHYTAYIEIYVKLSLQNTMKTITLEHRHFSSLQNTMSAITSEHSPKTGHHGYWQAQHFGRLRVLKRCVYQKKAPFRACFLTFCFQL
jgi:hypothetical protein